VLGEVSRADEAAVATAVAEARDAQGAFGARSLEDRAEALLRFRDALVDRADELALLIAREVGKPRVEALTHEVFVTAEVATFLAKHSPKALAPREVALRLLRHRRSYVHHAPRGVVAVLAPWNYPLLIAGGDVLAALAAGNGVVLKPSHHAPLVAESLVSLLRDAGLGEALRVVHGGAEVGAALVNAAPDFVTFTGSEPHGREVAASCAAGLIESTLQLGGNAAAVVCEDADLDRTAQALVWGGLLYSGQAGIGVERIFAHASVYDALVERVAQRVARLRVGDPERSDVDLGPVLTEASRERIERVVRDAVARGATLRFGGGRPVVSGRDGAFLEPAVLTECTDEMAVFAEEVFGPVLPFARFEDEDEVVRRANAPGFGLAAYVFTRDRERARSIAESLRAGAVMINDVATTYAAPEVAFGGAGRSGWGRVHGVEGLRAMCEQRHVNHDRVAVSREPFWYPYGERGYAAAMRAMKLLYRRASPVKKILDLF